MTILSHTSLDVDPDFSIEPDDVVRAQFFGLGSDGTVGANKKSIKIIGEKTDNFAQGYFVYDSKKSGAMTISHLRFGPRPIRSTYLISEANLSPAISRFCSRRYDVLKDLAPGGTFLLNTPFGPEHVWEHLPEDAQRRLIEQTRLFRDRCEQSRARVRHGRPDQHRDADLFLRDLRRPAAARSDRGDQGIDRKTYAKKGEEIVETNLRAVDQTLAHLYEVEVPDAVDSERSWPQRSSQTARRNSSAMCSARSCLAAATTAGQRVAQRRHLSDRDDAIGEAQSGDRNSGVGSGSLHPVRQMRAGLPARGDSQQSLRAAVLASAPETFKSRDARLPEWKGLKYTLQVAAEDCTGCGMCVDVCPARNKSEARLKAINMRPQPPLREAERKNWNFFLSIPEMDRDRMSNRQRARDAGAAAALRVFGRMRRLRRNALHQNTHAAFRRPLLIANATGCSSIYGGNLPTTPYAKNADGRGPAWANSLFEDNAEFGLGFRVSLDKQQEFAGELLQHLRTAGRATISPRKS